MKQSHRPHRPSRPGSAPFRSRPSRDQGAKTSEPSKDRSSTDGRKGQYRRDRPVKSGSYAPQDSVDRSFEKPRERPYANTRKGALRRDKPGSFPSRGPRDAGERTFEPSRERSQSDYRKGSHREDKPGTFNSYAPRDRSKKTYEPSRERSRPDHRKGPDRRDKPGKFSPYPSKDRDDTSGASVWKRLPPDDRKDTHRRDKRGQRTGRFAAKKYDTPRHEAPRHDPVASGNVLIWGVHAVRAAYLNPKRRCFRLWLTEAGQAAFSATVTEAREHLLKRPDAKKSERHELDRLTPPGSVHQGIVLETAPLPEPPLHDIIVSECPPDIILMLDQVTDPHNVGAILRSAAALGAGAVIMTERNAPNATGVLAKSASGALEYVPVLHVVNLARALDDLREAGYWSVGLAEEGEKDLSSMDLTGRTVLVLGAEGEGLRQLTRKKCDELARLPTGGPVGSLNVSNAAAVGLYEIRRQKKT